MTSVVQRRTPTSTEPEGSWCFGRSPNKTATITSSHPPARVRALQTGALCRARSQEMCRIRLSVGGSLGDIRKTGLRALLERAQTIPYGISVNPKKTFVD